MTSNPFPPPDTEPTLEKSQTPEMTSPAPDSPQTLHWNGWDAWVMLGVAILASVFASMTCQLGYLLLRKTFHWPTLVSGGLATNPYFVLLVQLILYILVIIFLFFLITRKYSLPFGRALGLLRIPASSAGRFVVVGLVMAICVMMLSTLFPSAKETPLEKIFGQGQAIYFFALFGVLVTPFTEELIFRGFLYPIFENFKGRSFAVIATAAIFSGLHVPQLWGSWSAISLIFSVGLILSLVRAVTGILTPSWIIHLAYNSTLVLSVIMARVLGPLAHSLK